MDEAIVIYNNKVMDHDLLIYKNFKPADRLLIELKPVLN